MESRIPRTRSGRFAIVLAGGRSSRMGTDKLALELDGSPLLTRVCRAAASFAGHIVVAGPEKDFELAPGPLPGSETTLEHAVEDPPFGGPAAGIAAALERLPTIGECLVLAGDLADPELVVTALTGPDAAWTPTDPLPPVDAIVPLDSGGRPQFLAGRYRLAPLHDAVATAGSTRDMSVRRLLGGLRTVELRTPDRTTRDIDTPAEAREFGVGSTDSRDS